MIENDEVPHIDISHVDEVLASFFGGQEVIKLLHVSGLVDPLVGQEESEEALDFVASLETVQQLCDDLLVLLAHVGGYLGVHINGQSFLDSAQS